MKPTLHQAAVVFGFVMLLGIVAAVTRPTLENEIARENTGSMVGPPRTAASQPTFPGLSKVTTDGVNFSGNGRTSTPLLLVGGNGNSGQFKPNRNGVDIQTFSGTLTDGVVTAYAGDPNGVITAAKGSLLLDYTTPSTWVNTSGGTVWSSLATGSTITTTVNNAVNALNYGWFGTGVDGSPTFDGSTTVLGMVPSGNAYTLVRHIFLDSPIGNSGITIKTNGFGVFVKTDFTGPASGTFTIQDDGGAGSNQAAGSGRVNGANEGGTGLYRGGKNGGVGGCNNAFGGNGNASGASNSNGPAAGYVTGNGGAGGAPFAGTAATSLVALSIYGSIGILSDALRGNGFNVSTGWAGGSGGGGGGDNGLGSGCGGGGGGGGGYTVFASKHVTNPTHVLVSANGGAGGNASGQSGGNSGGGGGGGGGGYAILVLGYGTAPTVAANGGAHGLGAGGAGVNGSDGTAGQVLLFQMN